MYYIKAYLLLAKRIVTGKSLPFHSKIMTISEAAKPENKKYLHNGIIRTATAIAKSKCRLHWLR